AYSDAFTLKLCSQYACELDCAGRIAVDTNCFAAHIDIATFDRTHLAFAQHAHHALGGFFWVVEQRIRSRARHEPAVVQGIAIGKTFSCELQLVCVASTGKLGSIRRK